MLKGNTVVELTDVNTGQKEIYEDNNLVTEALSDIFNTNIKGMLYNNTYFNNKSGEAWMLPITPGRAPTVPTGGCRREE